MYLGHQAKVELELMLKRAHFPDFILRKDNLAEIQE
jgi:hypothetical protein